MYTLVPPFSILYKVLLCFWTRGCFQDLNPWPLSHMTVTLPVASRLSLSCKKNISSKFYLTIKHSLKKDNDKETEELYLSDGDLIIRNKCSTIKRNIRRRRRLRSCSSWRISSSYRNKTKPIAFEEKLSMKTWNGLRMNRNKWRLCELKRRKTVEPVTGGGHGGSSCYGFAFK